MTDQKIDARVPSDTSKTGPHTTSDSGNQAAHARRSAEECFDRGLQYDDAGNHVDALEWYRKAADQGYAVAQVILGWHYHTGEGVPQDDAEAVRWFRLATDQGHAQAQYRLGVAYRDGDGVRQDYVEAHKWFDLAASQHPSGRKLKNSVRDRDFLVKKMTSSQIAKAERLAREWMAAFEKRQTK